MCAARSAPSQSPAGMKAFIDVTISSLQYAERLAVVIEVKNDDFITVFNTSSERLDGKNFSLAEGQEITCTFSLKLHLTPGTYFVSGWIHRYDIQKEYDHWESGTAFFVSSKKDVKGIVNLYPTVAIGEKSEYKLSSERP